MTNPILLDLPIPIQTDRLILRPMMPGDGKALFEVVEESRVLYRQWMIWVDGSKCWEDTEEFVRKSYADFILRKSMNLIILSQDRIVGVCGLNTINWPMSNAVIGYHCRISEQGKGYMSEAIAALTQYTFDVLGLKRLSIICNEKNIKSRAIPERLGYILEVTARGIVENTCGEDLATGCRYVRFDAKGLDGHKAKW